MLSFRISKHGFVLLLSAWVPYILSVESVAGRNLERASNIRILAAAFSPRRAETFKSPHHSMVEGIRLQMM